MKSLMTDFSFPGLSGSIYRFDPFPSIIVMPRIVDIWLPPGYAENPQLRYAVLYMHDGENLFDPSTSKLSQVDWGMDHTITRLMSENKIKPTLVVGIWSTEKRVLEYMPQKFTAGKTRERFPVILRGHNNNELQSDLYLRFIVEELKPYVDEHYRTLPEPSNTLVMGSSMGALVSLYAVCEYPKVFGGAGCISTHFPIGKGISLLYMQMNLPKPGDHKFYFDYGTKTLDKTYGRYQAKADEIMQAYGYRQGIDWITICYEGHRHSEVDWRKRVHVPLEFLLAK